jgi:hypothetical protein
MKSTPLHAGNINLRGKKCKVLSCRCCEVVDLRDDYESQRVAREEMNVSVEDYREQEA